jgi:hypothetical protein
MVIMTVELLIDGSQAAFANNPCEVGDEFGGDALVGLGVAPLSILKIDRFGIDDRQDRQAVVSRVLQ